jgi:hypothetical protein
MTIDEIRKRHKRISAAYGKTLLLAQDGQQAHQDRAALLSLLDGAKVGERVAEIEHAHQQIKERGLDQFEALVEADAHRAELLAIVRGLQARLDAAEAALGRVRGVLADWTRPAGLSGTSDRVMICKDLQEELGEFKEGGK